MELRGKEVPKNGHKFTAIGATNSFAPSETIFVKSLCAPQVHFLHDNHFPSYAQRPIAN